MHITRMIKRYGAAALTATTGVMAAATAQAQTALADLPMRGQPIDAGTGFQAPVTSIASEAQWLDNLLLYIIVAISLFVTGLLLWVILRYNAKKNPTPATFTHNSPLEVAWTVVPIVILVFIGAFSLPVLFNQQEIPEADITIKVTGYQWYWGYEYVDEDIEFESYMLGSNYLVTDADAENDLYPNVLNDAMLTHLAEYGYNEDQWLLATDTSVVVPVGATVVMQITGDPSGVIHSWTVPAFGVKQDGVPGRLAELWFTAEEEGVYFGQCSELCGMFHAYMPITVKVVEQEVYDEWLAAVRADAELPSSQRTYTSW